MIEEQKVKVVCIKLKQARQMNRILLIVIIIMSCILFNNIQPITVEEDKEIKEEKVVPLLPEEPMFTVLDDLPPLPKVKL